MSRQNVEVFRPAELVRRSFDAWNASTEDFEPLRAFFTQAGLNIVWDFTRFEGWPDRETYSGLDGTRVLWETWVGTWDEFYTEPLQIEGAGNAVFARARQTARGKGSGVAVEVEFSQVTWFDERGQAIRNSFFSDVGEALETAGLRS